MLKNAFVRYVAPVGAGVLALAQQAMADVPTEVTTELTSAGTDAKTIGAAVLVVIIGIFAFKMLRRAL